MSVASKDANSVATLLGVSNVDGTTPITIYADPVTHRILVDLTGGGFTELTATGAVNGINAAFTFSQQPTYIVSDGAVYKPLDNNLNPNWSWNAGTLTATMTIAPSSSIFGWV